MGERATIAVLGISTGLIALKAGAPFIAACILFGVGFVGLALLAERFVHRK